MVWKENGKFYFEYDFGHFAADYRVIEISENEFNSLLDGKIKDYEVARKYSR